MQVIIFSEILHEEKKKKKKQIFAQLVDVVLAHGETST